MLCHNKDISNGAEAKAVRVVSANDFSEEATMQSVPPFIYIKTTQIDPSLGEFENNEGCNCEQCGDSTCPCFQSGADGNSFNYMKFCDPSTCPCSSKHCVNHGTGSGENKFRLNAVLEVFFVNTQKQWGVRTKNRIGKNVYVCEYAGNLTNDNNDAQEDSYIFRLDYKKRAFMINAGSSGNVARFINHSCNPNLAAVVGIYGPREIPRLLLFSLRAIVAGEELSISYGDEWWKAKGLDCFCGAANCRYLR
uniref:Histone-lysine N-methyltransferase n=1 Tax=Ditylenchus dipsaci TaxID=166011 RepID=A0A915D5I7_9BILA